MTGWIRRHTLKPKVEGLSPPSCLVKEFTLLVKPVVLLAQKYDKLLKSCDLISTFLCNKQTFHNVGEKARFYSWDTVEKTCQQVQSLGSQLISICKLYFCTRKTTGLTGSVNSSTHSLVGIETSTFALRLGRLSHSSIPSDRESCQMMVKSCHGPMVDPSASRIHSFPCCCRGDNFHFGIWPPPFPPAKTLRLNSALAH